VTAKSVNRVARTSPRRLGHPACAGVFFGLGTKTSFCFFPFLLSFHPFTVLQQNPCEACCGNGFGRTTERRIAPKLPPRPGQVGHPCVNKNFDLLWVLPIIGRNFLTFFFMKKIIPWFSLWSFIFSIYFSVWATRIPRLNLRILCSVFQMNSFSGSSTVVDMNCHYNPTGMPMNGGR